MHSSWQPLNTKSASSADLGSVQFFYTLFSKLDLDEGKMIFDQFKVFAHYACGINIKNIMHAVRVQYGQIVTGSVIGWQKVHWAASKYNLMTLSSHHLITKQPMILYILNLWAGDRKTGMFPLSGPPCPRVITGSIVFKKSSKKDKSHLSTSWVEHRCS